MASGWITFKTNIDNSKFDKQIANLEDKIKKEEDKKIKKEIEISNLQEEINSYNEGIQKVKEYENEIRNLKKAKMEMIKANPKLLVGGDTAEYSAITQQITNTTTKLYQQESILQQQEKTLNGTYTKLEKIQQEHQAINGQINKYKTDINNLNMQRHQVDIEKVKGSFASVGSTIQNVIGKVAKLSLGVFALRSAYMAVRRASSELASYDTQYASNVEYIRYALTQMIAPVLRWIVQMAGTLLTFINRILNVLFGINLFSKASANNFAKMKAGASGAGKAVKEMKKDLLGFDEITRLTEQGETAGAGGVGGAIPDFDLSKLDTKLPNWMEKIIDVIAKLKDYWKQLLTVIIAFKTAITAVKIAGFVKELFNLKNMTTQTLAGIGLMTAGIVTLAGSIINLVMNWDTMTTREKVITSFLAVVGASFTALGYAIATGISVATVGIGALIALVVALATAIGTAIIKEEKEAKALWDVKKAQDKVTEAKKKARDAEDEYIRAVDEADEALKNLKDIQDKSKYSAEELFAQVQNGTLDYQNMNDEQRELYKAYLDNINAQDKLKTATDNLTQANKEAKISTWEEKMATDAQGKAFRDGSIDADKFKQSVIDAFNNGELEADEAQRLLGEAMAGMSADGQQTFMTDIPNAIKDGLDPKEYQTTWQRFKSSFTSWVNGLSTGTKIKLGVDLVQGNAVGFAGTALGQKVRKLFGYEKGAIVRLASGGIVNQPGRGVPLSSAIAGERGMEGVIPLTDTQQMSLIGEAIGRYVTVNLTNVTSMNGRVISRELKTIQNEQDFAYNG